MKSLFHFILAAFFFLVFANPCSHPTSIGPVPSNVQLNQNFPNPFTDSTTIQYGIPSGGVQVAFPLEEHS